MTRANKLRLITLAAALAAASGAFAEMYQYAETPAATQAAKPITLSTPNVKTEKLTGDKKLACEAVLCLSSGTRPGECRPALKRYYGISHRKPHKTLRARKNFLNMCPYASSNPGMKKLVTSIAEGAGRCDAAALNKELSEYRYKTVIVDKCGRTETVRYKVVRSGKPGYCKAYSNHEYTDLQDDQAVYVGKPERGGLWVPPSRYEKELEDFNIRVAKEDEALRKLKAEVEKNKRSGQCRQNGG